MKEQEIVDGDDILPNESRHPSFLDAHIDAVPETRFEHYQFFVKSTKFEMIWSALIVASTIIMCVELQYDSIDVSNSVHFYDPMQETWPHAGPVFGAIESVVGSLFLVEVVMKLVAFHARYFFDPWNVFDFLLATTWVFALFFQVDMPINPLYLRIFRLLRLMRLLRAFRALQMFAAGQVIFVSVKGCGPILLWASILLIIIMLVCSMLLALLLRPFIQDPNQDMKSRQLVFDYFGSFTRAFITLVGETLGFSGNARRIMDTVNEWYALFFILYKLFIGFALMNILKGIFLNETFKAAESNDEIMVLQVERKTKAHIAKMRKLWEIADATGDGRIGFQEFRVVTDIPGVQKWLASMDLDVADVERVFSLLDDGDGAISFDELCHGIFRLRGTARAIDMATVLSDVRKLQKQLDRMRQDTQCETPRNAKK
jgi:hypothetical protein